MNLRKLKHHRHSAADSTSVWTWVIFNQAIQTKNAMTTATIYLLINVVKLVLFLSPGNKGVYNIMKELFIIIVGFKKSGHRHVESRQSNPIPGDQEEMWRYDYNAALSCRSNILKLQAENRSVPRMWHLLARSGLSEWPRKKITVFFICNSFIHCLFNKHAVSLSQMSL